ncbi:taste receptor type 2 member 9-like [Vipera latastei]
MSPLMQAIFQVAITAHSSLGMVASGFIVVASYTMWVKGKKVPTCEVILMCLSLSRILLQGTILHCTFSSALYQWNVLRIQSILLVFASTACLWFAACLSVFYWAKIATFTHRYFLLVKLRITEMVPLLLVGSMLVSLNITMENQVGSISYLKAFSLYLTWAVLPFLLFVASSTLLIASLWRHSRQMRQSTMDLEVNGKDTSAYL